MAQPCKFCQGKGAVQYAQNLPPAVCPVCGGSSVQEDPGLFYVYELTFALAGNAANQQNSVQIKARSFRWMFAIATFTGVFTTQLSDGSSQRQFSNQQVHVNNLFGTAQNPFPLLTPYVFKKLGTIQAISSDLSGGANNIRIAFAGVEIDD
jgi:hypothetical protein